MKRLFSLFTAALLCLSLVACQSAPDEPDEPDGEEDTAWDYRAEYPEAEPTGVTLNIYNWGEYIDDEVLDVNEAFTYITGIGINYKTFENNESMYALLSSGAADYDVIFPSDYMIAKLIEEGMLAKLNFDNIPNYRYIGENYKNLEYDPENAYSVPYTWGTVGIFYNTKYVDEADLALGWDLLWCDKYKDRIIEPSELNIGHKATLMLTLTHEAGNLSRVLNEVSAFGANILTITQSLPLHGTASIMISLDTNKMDHAIEQLIDDLQRLEGVEKVRLLAVE